MNGPPEIIRTQAGVDAFLAGLEGAPFLAVDTETTGLDPNTDRVLLIQVGTGDEQALIDAQEVGVAASEKIFHPDRLIVLHHAKFDLKMLAGLGADLSTARVMDTMLAEQLLVNGRRTDLNHGGVALNILAERYAGMELDKSIRGGFTAARSIDDLGPAEFRYALRDVEATWKIFAKQLPRLAREGLMRPAGIEGAAAFAFGEMERHGMPLDTVGWRKLIDAANEQRAGARLALDREFDSVVNRDLFGATDINYDSEHEVLDALAKLGLPLESTRREVLLATGHPAARALVDYREHQKIVTAYGESFLEHVSPATGRLHPTFKSMGASTGRASCKDPNLQNIPSSSDFRACFRAPDGRKLITADYSSAELRILAEMSEDPVFLRTFRDDGDLHSIVASQVFRKPVSKTENSELRARAKAINFGLAYGMGAQGLANQIGASLKEAEELLERYFRAFPSIRGYLERSAKTAMQRGYAETLSGRKFWFVDMDRKGSDWGSKVRVGKNMPIQGTNADMTKVAMARIARALHERKLDGFLVNMVHDEVVVEASEADAEAVRELVVHEMVSAGAEFVKKVPVGVDVKTSEAWEK